MQAKANICRLKRKDIRHYPSSGDGSSTTNQAVSAAGDFLYDFHGILPELLRFQRGHLCQAVKLPQQMGRVYLS